MYFAQRGYVYVYQDVRGRHESDGAWEPFRDDERDGVDTIAWAAKQPWSNGKVAMQGGSYLGQNQWRAAQARPPALVTIFPMVASTSIYHDWITLNGGWRLSFNFGWGPVRMESRIMQNIIYRSGKASEGLDPIEVQANQFAASLLMPSKLVRASVEAVPKPLDEDDVAELARKFNVSEQAMTIRLTTLGFL